MFLDLLLNVSTSTYFVMGASLVIILCVIFIILPLMTRMKNLDDIILKKFATLPSSESYSVIFKQLERLAVSEEAALDQFQLLQQDVKNFREELKKYNDTAQNEYLTELKELDESLLNFANYIRDNETRSEVMLSNLVAARIDTTDVLIKIIKNLKNKDLVESVDIETLQDIKYNLQKGYDSVQRQQNNNYKVMESNVKSGYINRFIDGEF